MVCLCCLVTMLSRFTLFLSGSIPVVYVSIGIREIRQTQLNICYSGRVVQSV
jgi:hypothetical protein